MSTKFINANTVQQSRMSFIFSTDRIQQVSKFHILQSASVLTRHWRWIATTSDDPLLTAGSMSVPPQHKRSHWVGWCRQQTEFRTVCTVLGPTESQICNTAPLILHYKHNTHSLTAIYKHIANKRNSEQLQRQLFYSDFSRQCCLDQPTIKHLHPYYQHSPYTGKTGLPEYKMIGTY